MNMLESILKMHQIASLIEWYKFYPVWEDEIEVHYVTYENPTARFNFIDLTFCINNNH